MFCFVLFVALTMCFCQKKRKEWMNEKRKKAKERSKENKTNFVLIPLVQVKVRLKKKANAVFLYLILISVFSSFSPCPLLVYFYFFVAVGNLWLGNVFFAVSLHTLVWRILPGCPCSQNSHLEWGACPIYLKSVMGLHVLWALQCYLCALINWIW